MLAKRHLQRNPYLERPITNILAAGHSPILHHSSVWTCVQKSQSKGPPLWNVCTVFERGVNTETEPKLKDLCRGISEESGFTAKRGL